MAKGRLDGGYDFGDMGYFYAEDAGSAILKNRIDIYMGDDLVKQQYFGRRNMRVYIISLPEDKKETADIPISEADIPKQKEDE